MVDHSSVQRELKVEPRVQAVEALKFKQILAGGTHFRLRLERTNDARKLRFKLWNERGEFSSGRLLVELEGR